MIVRYAYAYVRAKALLGPAQTRRRRRLLQPYADLVGWPVDRLDITRGAERMVETLDELLLIRPAFPLLPPLRLEDETYVTEALAAGPELIIGFEHTTHRGIINGVIHSLGLPMRIIAPPSARRPPRTKTHRTQIVRNLSARLDRSTGTYTRRVRDAFRVQAAGGVVIIGTDGRVGKQLAVRFLDTIVNRPTGPARLALQTGAPIVMAVPRMEPGGHFVLRFFPPIGIRHDIPAREAVQDVVAGIARLMESHYRENPCAAGNQFVRYLFRGHGRLDPTAGTRPTTSPVCVDGPMTIPAAWEVGAPHDD